MPVTPSTMTTTAPQPKAWLPDEVGPVVIQPVAAESVAISVLGHTSAPGSVDAFRVPIVTGDPAASWVAEGQEITVSASELGETGDYFHKVAGITVISSEMAQDASPDIAQQVGAGLGRDIARKIDAAFFGKRADTTLAPKGLGDLTSTGTVTAGAHWTNTDPFVQAIYQAGAVGATLAAFVAHPADALALAQIKDQTGSQRPLLGNDPTHPTRPVLAGVPLYTSPAVTEGEVWGLPGGGRVVIAVRQDILLQRDESVFFTSDRIALRATMRVTFLYPHEAAIQKITRA